MFKLIARILVVISIISGVYQYHFNGQQPTNLNLMVFVALLFIAYEKDENK